MNTKGIIVLIVFIGWAAVSWRWYTCGVKGFCGDDPTDDAVATTATSESTPSPAAKQAPLLFTWSGEQPTVNASFATLQDSLRNEVGNNEALQITGQYFSDEENTTTYPNLGLARAQQTKALFAPDMDTAQILVAARQVERRPGVESEPFRSVVFATVPVIPDDAEVVELDDRTIIYFPFGSSDPKLSARINEYLTALVERVKDSDQQILIVGHTDNVGEAEPNRALGQQRAEIIEDILTEQGIASERITTDSAGESQPIASNETDRGRQKNRRIELMVQ